MKIAITGSTGLIGTCLIEAWRETHDIVRLVRPETKLTDDGTTKVVWDPYRGGLDPGILAGCDVIIHLAGASIAGRRWSSSYKKVIYDSRVKTTQVLVEAILNMDPKPRLFIGASAVGYYGDRPWDEVLDESASGGKGFLAETCRAWEDAAIPLREHLRVVHTRFGVVLSTRGGALSKMLRPFRLGLGGILGNGQQGMSWVALAELPLLLMYIIENERLEGPVNATAPEPVTNAQFTRTLARILRRPAFFHLPSFMLRVMMGEMADELLLSGQRVMPEKLLQAGYSFRYGELETTLRRILSEQI